MKKLAKPGDAKRIARDQELNDLIDRLNDASGLDDWNAYAESVDVPGELFPALMTGRPELLALLQPRAMTAEEVGKLYKLISVLVRTNQLLQQHARAVAHQVDIWSDSFKQLATVGHRVQLFANFKRTDQSLLDAEAE